MVALSRRQTKPQKGNTLLSHALAFAAGLIIHSFVSREDCGDLVLKDEISKQESNTAPASTTSNSALRPPQPAQTEEDPQEKELNFYDIGLRTGTDKVQGQKNLHLCLKEGLMCNEPKHVK